MHTVGVMAQFIIRPGKEHEVASFFKEGLPKVQAQPQETLWFDFRINSTTYGAFAAFANEADRAALLSSGGPMLAKKYAEIFAQPPKFEMVEMLESRVAKR